MKCSISPGYWAGLTEKEREYIREKMAEFPHMAPCPVGNGWWIVRNDECTKCRHCIREGA